MKMIAYNGETHTIKEWCDIIGVSYNRLYQRLNAGWSIEKAFSSELRRKIEPITYNGETHTVKEWSNIIGLPYNRLYQRLKAGWPVEKILDPNLH